MTKNKMTLKAEVLLYIQEHFSNQAFFTKPIYLAFEIRGVSAGSIGGTLQALKNEGYLENRFVQRSFNGRVAKEWYLVHS
ncbi:hypothetical protein [Enterococcus hirae]|uniref:hypothetical protein n=1 Tax=Enterococcus hirae TaxID=1354 RepID=UPI00295562A6|nr:hypothetical protein [Enterococcus hirae]MDV7815860.1 hypothetical protein [Enterococcus hirae]